MTTVARAVLRFVVSLVCLAAIPLLVPYQEILKQGRDIEPVHLCVAFVLIAMNTGISSLRFHEMMKSFRISAPLRLAHKINVFSQVAGVFALQTLGQMVFRTAYGGRYVEHPQRLALLTIVEKAIALSTLSLIGLVGSYYITRHIELGGGSVQLFIIAVSIIVCLYGTYSIALTASQRRYCRRVWRMLIQSGLEKAVGLSFAMHGLMLAAYMVIASSYLEQAPLTMIAALFSVVMLGAALPISFAGWGIRELSAGFVFSFLGYDPSVGIVVAATIGLISLLALGGHVVVAAFISKAWRADVSSDGSVGAGTNHFELMVGLFCGFGVALLIGIQIRVPTATGELTVNLADPVAFLGAISFLAFWYRDHLHQAMWRLNGLAPAMLLLFALILYGWVLGYMKIGFSAWATYNRGLGYFVLLVYMLAGSTVTAYFGRSAVRSVLRVFLVTNLCILVMYYFSQGLLEGQTRELLEWRGTSYSGLIGNRNALAFAMSIILAVTLSIRGSILGRWRPAAIVLAVFLIVISGSRTGMAVALLVMVMALFFRSISPKELAQIAVVTSVLAISHYAASDVLPRLIGGSWSITPSGMDAAGQGTDTGTVSAARQGLSAAIQTFGEAMERLSNVGIGTDAEINVGPAELMVFQSERFEGYRVALDIWLSHPILGSGMGTFVHHYTESVGVPLVVHNSVLWILAEMGLVDLLLFLPLPFAVVAYLLKRRGRALPWDDLALLLCLVAAALFSMAHDMLYQRILWFMLGLLAANKFRLRDTLTSRVDAALRGS